MEIISFQSEKLALEMFVATLQRSDAWMAMRVQLASLNRDMMDQLGLSRETLSRIRRIGLSVAEKLSASGLSSMKGKIFIFQDGDILVLYEKDAVKEDALLSELRQQNNLIQCIEIETLKKSQQDIARFIRTKNDSANEYQVYECIVAMTDNLDAWTKPEHAVTESIRKKRRMRKSSTILVIEDNHLVRDLLTKMLKDQHRVIAAPDAKEGILSYAYYAPNVVFLDINMPGLDGHETLKRIMSLDTDAYVVMISGNSSHDNVVTTYSNGAAGFLHKPFTKVKLNNYIMDCPSLVAKHIVQDVAN